MTLSTKDDGWDKVIPTSSGYLLPVVRRLVESLHPSSLLDLGCGNGSILRGLSDLCPNRVGCDADAAGIALAQKADPSSQYLVQSINKTGPSIPGGPFSVIISTEVVEHLYDPDDLFLMARGQAKPGSIFLVSTPYHGWLKNLAIAATGHWDHHHTPLWTGGHVKFWSRLTLAQLGQRNGWLPVGFHGIGRLPFLWKSMIMVFRLPTV